MDIKISAALFDFKLEIGQKVGTIDTGPQERILGSEIDLESVDIRLGSGQKFNVCIEWFIER